MSRRYLDNYPFLTNAQLEPEQLPLKMKALRKVGVPYTDEQIANARKDLEAQASAAGDMDAMMKRYPKAVQASGTGEPTELDALVAYLQVLGTMVDFADTSTEKLQQ